MSTAVKELYVKISANMDDFKKSIRDVNKDLTGLADAAGKAFDKIADRANDGIAAGVARAGAAARAAAGDFADLARAGQNWVTQMMSMADASRAAINPYAAMLGSTSSGGGATGWKGLSAAGRAAADDVAAKNSISSLDSGADARAEILSVFNLGLQQKNAARKEATESELAALSFSIQRKDALEQDARTAELASLAFSIQRKDAMAKDALDAELAALSFSIQRKDALEKEALQQSLAAHSLAIQKRDALNNAQYGPADDARGRLSTFNLNRQRDNEQAANAAAYRQDLLDGALAAQQAKRNADAYNQTQDDADRRDALARKISADRARQEALNGKMGTDSARQEALNRTMAARFRMRADADQEAAVKKATAYNRQQDATAQAQAAARSAVGSSFGSAAGAGGAMPPAAGAFVSAAGGAANAAGFLGMNLVRMAGSGLSMAISGFRAARDAAMGFAGAVYRAANAAGSSNFSRVMGAGVLAFGKEMISSNSTFEKAEISLESLTGSAATAKDMLAKLQEFAANTPFDISGLAKNAQFLLTQGFAAEKVIPILRRLGDAVALRGVADPGAAMESAALAMVRIQNQGKLTYRDIRALGSAFDLVAVIAKKTGQTREQVTNRIHAGGVGAGEALNAIMSIADDPRFAGSAERIGGTFSGMMSRLKSVFMQFSATAGKPLFDAVSAGLKSFLGFLQSAAGSGAAKKIADGIRSVIDRVAPFKDVLVSAIPTILKVGAALGGMALVMPAVNTALRIAVPLVYALLNPINLLIGAVGYGLARLVSAKGLGGAWGEIVSGATTAWASVKEAAGAVWDWISAKVSAVASAVGPVMATGVAGAAILFNGLGAAIFKAWDYLTGFSAETAMYAQKVAGAVLAVLLFVGGVKLAASVLSALGVTKVASAVIYAAWTGVVLAAKVAVFAFNAVVAAATLLLNVGTAASGLFAAGVAGLGVAVVSAVPIIAGLGLAWVGYRGVVDLATGAMDGFVAAGKAAADSITGVGLSGSALSDIGDTFSFWKDVLGQVAAIAMYDMPAAMEIAGLAATGVFEDVKRFAPPIFAALATSFEILWAKMSDSFHEQWDPIMRAWSKGPWAAMGWQESIDFGSPRSEYDKKKAATEADEKKKRADLEWQVNGGLKEVAEAASAANTAGSAGSWAIWQKHHKDLKEAKRKLAEMDAADEGDAAKRAELEAALDALEAKQGGGEITRSAKERLQKELIRKFDASSGGKADEPGAGRPDEAAGEIAKIWNELKFAAASAASKDVREAIVGRLKDAMDAKDYWDEYDKYDWGAKDSGKGGGGKDTLPPFADDKKDKFSFMGFSELWKKTQESINGDGALDAAKRTATGVESIAEFAKRTAESGDRMVEEIKKIPGGLA